MRRRENANQAENEDLEPHAEEAALNTELPETEAGVEQGTNTVETREDDEILREPTADEENDSGTISLPEEEVEEDDMEEEEDEGEESDGDENAGQGFRCAAEGQRHAHPTHDICCVYKRFGTKVSRKPRKITAPNVLCHGCQTPTTFDMKKPSTCSMCRTKIEASLSEQRERSCGNIRLRPEKICTLSSQLLQPFKQKGALWIEKPLNHTSAGTLTSLSFLEGPPAAQPSAPAPMSTTGRLRPLVWACDGNNFPFGIESNSTPSRQWTVVILLSYPVNERSMVLSADGSEICRTLQNVFDLLLSATNQVGAYFISPVELSSSFFLLTKRCTLASTHHRRVPFRWSSVGTRKAEARRRWSGDDSSIP